MLERGYISTVGCYDNVVVNDTGIVRVVVNDTGIVRVVNGCVTSVCALCVS